MGIKVKKAEIEAFLRAHPHIEDPHLFNVGQNIGEWRISAFIGKGGSGEVYSAKHSALGVVVAIKILSRDDHIAKDRFRREAQVFAENPMSVFPRFFGYGQVNGRPYMVIELLEHLPLPGTDREVAHYFLRVCIGVSRLHSLGLVHRDIKPQNILQRGATGEPVLIDLGLVKDVTLPVVHRGESLSIVNGKAVGVGTPRYAAPEQFAGGEISPAADIHALGMLANDCFGGNPPRCWARIIRRSTSSIPSQRYGSVAQFAKAIRHRHWVNRLVLLLLTVSVVLGVVVLALRDSMPYPVRPRAEALPPESVAATNAPAVGRTLRVRRNPDQTNTAFAADYGAAGYPPSEASSAGGTMRGVRALPSPPKLRPGVRFVPDSDSGAESTRKGAKWPKSGVFSGDKEVDPNF